VTAAWLCDVTKPTAYIQPISRTYILDSFLSETHSTVDRLVIEVTFTAE